MTAVRFARGVGGFSVTFYFDAAAVDLVKSVPSRYRSWNKNTRAWWVADPYGPWLADDMARHGFQVAGAHERRQEQRTGRDTVTDEGAWAQMLFRRVGPERAAAVHRALTKVLHPDAGGDTALMQELNDARG